eukprot:1150376-Pelagomonas_calceolata.AAC.2
MDFRQGSQCQPWYYWLDTNIGLQVANESSRYLEDISLNVLFVLLRKHHATYKAERINFSEDCEMIYVEWHPKWEAADMLHMHPDLDALVQAFDLEERPEGIEDPSAIEIDLDNL